MSEPARYDCNVCHYSVEGPGPWCVLYTESRWCVPVANMRLRIFKADEIGDGPMVNALCADLRKRTNDNFVP